jgi:hypothetical protein
MATRQPAVDADATSATGIAYHECTCGASFGSTDELLSHAREVHGLRPY